ncbi:MAG: restriction endonuclease subunit S [Desulfamplus sp.]|nr:restriction endonuclease subunit S [Desulfamplus sp.]
MSWKVSKLGDILTITSGGTPSRQKNEYYDNGQVPWVKTGDLKKKYIDGEVEKITELALKDSSAKLFPPQTVLFALYGATIGACSILRIEAATNQACAAFLPNEKIVPEFLFYYLQTRKQDLIRQGQGGAQPNISGAILKRYPIPLPPLETQKRIVELLDRAQGLIDKRKEQIALMDDLIQSLFYEMFGDPVTNPKGWEVKKLCSLGSLKRGKSKHRPRNAPELLGGIYPLVQTGDIANAGLYLKTYSQTYSELGLAQSKLWNRGTLCVTIAANIAKTAILDFDACFPDSVVAFLPSKDVDNMYVQLWFGFLQKIIEANAPESAQKNINLQILSDLDIPVPPIDLQTQFAERVQKIEAQKEAMNASLKELEENFQSIMQRAFKGEL